MATVDDGVQYSVTFINQSSNSGNFCLFQTDPNLGVANVFPLAWFSKYVRQGDGQQVEFDWQIKYSFVWGATGQLKPGVNFKASQILPADLSTTNQVTLDYLDGAYAFVNQGPGSNQGSLYIAEDNTVPLKQASVGIGMSGSGSFAVQAQPNTVLTFTPHPQYWCVFGTFTKGQVLDIQSIMGSSANIKFPPGTYAMYAILKENNTWTIDTVASVNQRLLAARESDPEITLEKLDLSAPLKLEA